MADFSWKEFLKQLSRLVLADPGMRDSLPEEMVKTEWLGYQPATEQELLNLEKRIQNKLPPSYREFLLTTNGWKEPGRFVYDLLPAEKVGWFRDIHNENWIKPWVEAEEEGGGRIPISDEDYFLYGPKQNAGNFRMEYWIDSLVISEEGDASFFLLNPHVIDKQGEWEAWFFASWMPGARRYRTFPELMQAEYDSLIEKRNNK